MIDNKFIDIQNKYASDIVRGDLFPGAVFCIRNSSYAEIFYANIFFYHFLEINETVFKDKYKSKFPFIIDETDRQNFLDFLKKIKEHTNLTKPEITESPDGLNFIKTEGFSSIVLKLNPDTEDLFKNRFSEPRWISLKVLYIRHIDAFSCTFHEETQFFQSQTEIENFSHEIASIAATIDGTFIKAFHHNNITEHMFASKGVQNLSGYNYNDLEYNCPWLLIHPDDIVELFSRCYEELKHGGYSFNYRLIYKNGDVHWENEKATLINVDGDNLQYIAIITDITESITNERRLKKEKDRIELILLSKNETYFDYNLKDKKFSLTYSNPENGERHEIIIGLDEFLEDYISPDYHKVVKDAIGPESVEILRSSKTLSHEILLRNSLDTDFVWHRTLYSCHFDENDVGESIFGSIKNIERRKKLEEDERRRIEVDEETGAIKKGIAEIKVNSMPDKYFISAALEISNYLYIIEELGREHFIVALKKLISLTQENFPNAIISRECENVIGVYDYTKNSLDFYASLKNVFSFFLSIFKTKKISIILYAGVFDDECGCKCSAHYSINKAYSTLSYVKKSGSFIGRYVEGIEIFDTAGNEITDAFDKYLDTGSDFSKSNLTFLEDDFSSELATLMIYSKNKEAALETVNSLIGYHYNFARSEIFLLDETKTIFKRFASWKNPNVLEQKNTLARFSRFGKLEEDDNCDFLDIFNASGFVLMRDLDAFKPFKPVYDALSRRSVKTVFMKSFGNNDNPLGFIAFSISESTFNNEYATFNKLLGQVAFINLFVQGM